MADDNTSLGSSDLLGLLALIYGASSQGNLTGTAPGTYSQTGGLTQAGQSLWDAYKGELSNLGDAKGYNLISRDKYGNQVTTQMANPQKMHLLNKMAGIASGNTQKLGYQSGNTGAFGNIAKLLAGLGPGWWDKLQNAIKELGGSTDTLPNVDMNDYPAGAGDVTSLGPDAVDTASTATDAVDAIDLSYLPF